MNLLGNVGHGVNDRPVADPHVARGNPVASHLIGLDLVRASALGDDNRHRLRLPVAKQVEGSLAQGLVHDPAPCVAVSPPLEVVLLAWTAHNVHASVVAKLQLERVERDGPRRGELGLVRLGARGFLRVDGATAAPGVVAAN